VDNKLTMNGRNRKDIRPGVEVDVVLKRDQASGKRTRGIVKDVLTSSSFHPHGIKVRLESGEVGRVQEVFEEKKEQASNAARPIL
jgi:uncharacterized repeat protein (TIGR03833 family)